MDCYYHGYSGGPGGPCTRCENDNGPMAGYYKSMAENAKYNSETEVQPAEQTEAT